MEVVMDESGLLEKNALRGSVMVIRQVGRFWGLLATMLLNAAALGCVIAGLSAAFLAAIDSGAPRAQVHASTDEGLLLCLLAA